MKTLYKTLLLVVMGLLFITINNVAWSQNNVKYKTISGIVKDENTLKTLSHVNISAQGSNIGTITNEDGQFSLNINDSIKVTHLILSRLGYKNKLLSIENRTYSAEILLTPDVTELKEILIEAEDPAEIVKQAVAKIADNYSSAPNLLTGFYRETAQKRNEYITVSEAIINIYKTPYKEDETRDKVQVYKGRTLLSPKLSDTIVVKMQGGPNIAKYLDVTKNKFLLLDAETLHFYKYTLEGTAAIGERPHYIIDFEPQVSIEYPLYYGKLFIDKETLTFSRAETSLDMDNKEKATNTILVKRPNKMRFQPVSLTSLVTYKTKDGKSYLNYIRNEIKFKCNWKRFFYIFAPTYTVTSEVVITDRAEEHVKPFSYKETFNEKQTLLDKIENFQDPLFWEGYNIIEPTISLENAVDKLKKQNDK